MRAIYSIVAAACFAVLYGCGASSVSSDLPNSRSADLLRADASTSTFNTLYAFEKKRMVQALVASWSGSTDFSTALRPAEEAAGEHAIAA
jgi:hypothetical protein